MEVKAMENVKLKIIYQDENLLVVDKPSGIIVFSEKPIIEKTLIDLLLEQFPYLKNVGKSPRYGIIHRLDRDTSGILLVAKNDKSLIFSQNQFKERKVIKKYIALVVGNIKKDHGEIKTLIGRSPKDRTKQKVYFPFEPNAKGKREAITKYKVLSTLCSSDEKGQKDFYTIVEVEIKTGRKHQIRTHLNYLGHPIAGDKIYGFKNQVSPQDLKRQFLHAGFLKIKLLEGKEQEFKSEIPEDLIKCLKKLNENFR